MEKTEFFKIRKRLKKTQKEIASLLGVSKKTVESYEQGVRNIPNNVGRILYFLLFKLNSDKLGVPAPCWDEKNCPPEIKENCVAWLADEGIFCWFITGKSCALEKMLDDTKESNCFNCSYFKESLEKIWPAEAE